MRQDNDNPPPAGIPIGSLTAFVGAPFFLWLITGKGDRVRVCTPRDLAGGPPPG